MNDLKIGLYCIPSISIKLKLYFVLIVCNLDGDKKRLNSWVFLGSSFNKFSAIIIAKYFDNKFLLSVDINIYAFLLSFLLKFSKSLSLSCSSKCSKNSNKKITSNFFFTIF